MFEVCINSWDLNFPAVGRDSEGRPALTDARWGVKFYTEAEALAFAKETEEAHGAWGYFIRKV